MVSARLWMSQLVSNATRMGAVGIARDTEDIGDRIGTGQAVKQDRKTGVGGRVGIGRGVSYRVGAKGTNTLHDK